MATKLCPDFTVVVPERAPTPPWPVALFVLGIAVAVAGLVVVNQGLTMLGLGVGALGGYIWRHKVRRARAQR